jgi:hypothetical protein
LTKNVTMAMDEDLLKKARKIAVDKNTTMSGLIRAYLINLVEQEEKSKKEIISELTAILDHSHAVIGKKNWNRKDLYER